MKNEIMYDTELVQSWISDFFEREIEDVQNSIANERLWEKGCPPTGDNPHTQNILNYSKYLETLKRLYKIAKNS